MSNCSVDLLKSNGKVEWNSSPEPVDNDLVVDDLDSSKTCSLVRGIKPGQRLVVSVKKLEACERWVQELFLRSYYGLGSNWIPKHLVSLEEKYLRCCLESIYTSAYDASPAGLYFMLNSLDMRVSAHSWLSPKVFDRSLFKVSKYGVERSMETGSGNIASTDAGQWVVGSITESHSMMRILESPLFQRIERLENSSKVGTTDFEDDKKFIQTKLNGPNELSYISPQKLEEDKWPLEYHQRYRSDSIERCPVSISSVDSLLTEQASCSCSNSSHYQGMLQCLWKGGLPHFEFSVDNQKELYIAKSMKVERPNDKLGDYIYMFHLKYSGEYDDSLCCESDIVGKMKVSTSRKLCQSKSMVMEYEFVFCGVGESHGMEIQSVSVRGKKQRTLSRVMELFKTGQSLKQRNNPRLGASSIVFESHPEDFQETGRSVCRMERTDILNADFSPNLEMAAFVVKHHIQEGNHYKDNVGGWGLKFLQKFGSKQVSPPVQDLESSSCFRRNSEDCHTSIDIIFPAGAHGMARNGKDLPSSILERWKSGGQCDCGGWDMGCPLTVLRSFLKQEEGLPGSVRQNDCKSFDVFMESTSEQGTQPFLKVTNIHDGLYMVNFRSTMSVMQCFSVVVAMIHSQMPSLRPKHVQL